MLLSNKILVSNKMLHTMSRSPPFISPSMINFAPYLQNNHTSHLIEKIAIICKK